MENRFNLIDEPWIPIADVGLVSLKDIFTHPEYRALGGNPVQKIALMKLLLAIAQGAHTPADEDEWKHLGASRLARDCLAYLEKWHDRFYLYGDKPFLQMPAIAKAEIKPYGAVAPQIATGNTTVLLQSQVERPLDNAGKGLLLLEQMAFALSGKKTDNSAVLTPAYAGKRNDKGKPSSAKPGSAVAHMGLLHNFLQGDSLQKTLWLNLMTTQDVQASQQFSEGTGQAPWEDMPQGEDCPIARKLRNTLQGRLIPLCRFCLLTDDGLHYSEGIHHINYKEGAADPSVAVDFSGKDPKALWTNPEKRPWRELTALLGFIGQGNSGFDSLQLRVGLSRIRDCEQSFAIWSGGLRVSSNAGEQYVSGSDDFVESAVWLQSEMLGDIWFANFKSEMEALDHLGKTLYGCVMAYFKEQKGDGKELASQATHLFWQLCERQAQALIDASNTDEAARVQRLTLRRRFANDLHQAYDHFCPQDTARQLDAWAKSRPNIAKYLKQEVQ